MSVRADRIRDILVKALQPSDISIEDESWKHAGHEGARESGGGHFQVRIVGECFHGRSRIERQRMVMQALAEEFGPTIHALSIRALTPEEGGSS